MGLQLCKQSKNPSFVTCIYKESIQPESVQKLNIITTSVGKVESNKPLTLWYYRASHRRRTASFPYFNL